MEGLNSSQCNATEALGCVSSSWLGIQSPLIGVIVVLFCACVLLEDLVSFVVLWRTKRMVFAIKFLSLVVTFADCLFVSVIISSMVLALYAPSSTILRETVTESGRLAVALSWTTIAVISVERVVFVAWPRVYTKHATRTRVVTFSATVWAVCLGSKLVTRYYILPTVYQHQGALKQTRETGYILTTILGVCLLICIACYAVIVQIAQVQRRRIRALQVPASNTQTVRYGRSSGVWAICLAFVLCYLPVFGAYISRLGKEEGHLKMLTFGMNMLACAVNPVLYGWRFQECRYIMLLMLAPLSRRLQARAEAMRLIVFSIVTTED